MPPAENPMDDIQRTLEKYEADVAAKKINTCPVQPNSPAFPVSLHGWGDNGASGLTIEAYLAAKFAAAWLPLVLDVVRLMPETDIKTLGDVAEAANKLGIHQAKHFIKKINSCNTL